MKLSRSIILLVMYTAISNAASVTPEENIFRATTPMPSPPSGAAAIPLSTGSEVPSSNPFLAPPASAAASSAETASSHFGGEAPVSAAASSVETASSLFGDEAAASAATFFAEAGAPPPAPFLRRSSSAAGDLRHPTELAIIGQVVHLINELGISPEDARNLIPNLFTQGFPAQRAAALQVVVSPIVGQLIPGEVSGALKVLVNSNPAAQGLASYDPFNLGISAVADQLINGVLLAIYDQTYDSHRRDVESFLRASHASANDVRNNTEKLVTQLRIILPALAVKRDALQTFIAAYKPPVSRDRPHVRGLSYAVASTLLPHLPTHLLEGSQLEVAFRRSPIGTILSALDFTKENKALLQKLSASRLKPALANLGSLLSPLLPLSRGTYLGECLTTPSAEDNIAFRSMAIPLNNLGENIEWTGATAIQLALLRQAILDAPEILIHLNYARWNQALLKGRLLLAMGAAACLARPVLHRMSQHFQWDQYKLPHLNNGETLVLPIPNLLPLFLIGTCASNIANDITTLKQPRQGWKSDMANLLSLLGNTGIAITTAASIYQPEGEPSLHPTTAFYVNCASYAAITASMGLRLWDAHSTVTQTILPSLERHITQQNGPIASIYHKAMALNHPSAAAATAPPNQGWLSWVYINTAGRVFGS